METATEVQLSELRLGNWVVYPTYEDEGVTDWGEKQLEEDDFVELIQRSDIFVKPIRLSPELLEKCGFKKWASGCFSKQIDEYICFQIEDDGRYGFWSDSVENECNFTVLSQDNRIHYLHQLQNLYHALTGQELEVNL